MAFAIRSQCDGARFVLSSDRSCKHSARHSADTAGTKDRSCSLVSSGMRPSAVFPDAMVPPVPIIRIRFMGVSSRVFCYSSVCAVYGRNQSM